VTSDALVLAAVEAFWKHTGRHPSLSELAGALKVRAGATLLPYLRRLEDAGALEREPEGGPGVARSVWPTGLRGHIQSWFAQKNS
jgi:hypothetical protein